MGYERLTLQIFLTVYHGTLISTFFYDYIIRNLVRIFVIDITWSYITNIVLGVVFLAFIVWAIMSVWKIVKRNLLIVFVILIVIFIIRLAVGITDYVEKRNAPKYTSQKEELVIFIAQVTIHLAGIVATWLLASQS
jgi:hypothetical protein